MDSVREQIEEALQRSKIHKETVYGILRQIADAIEPPAPTPAPVKVAAPAPVKVAAPAPVKARCPSKGSSSSTTSSSSSSRNTKEKSC